MRMIALVCILLSCTIITPMASMAQEPSVGLQVFYDELSSYGTWVYNHDYGYVWVPDVAPGFVPYSTNGYWVFTNEGWTWVSDYPWGWAPFHYGRWYMDDYYGAMWVPDTEWGPGWVTWRRSGEFYGWAPIGPGVSISFAYSNGYQVPYQQWTFVRDGDFGRTNISRYYINTTYNVTIINNSTVINNTRVHGNRRVPYNTGPERSEVERRSGKKFEPVTIYESTRPIQQINRNRLEIYKPRIKTSTSEEKRAAPAKAERQTHPSRQPAGQQTQPYSKKQEIQQQQQQPAQPVRQPQQQKQQQQPRQQQNQVQPVKQKPVQPNQSGPPKETDKGRDTPNGKPPRNFGR